MTTPEASAGPRRNIVVAAWAALVVAIIALAATGGGPLTAPKAIVLGTVEGVTEYLPVSSTGHLLVTERLLDVDEISVYDAETDTFTDGKDAADTYAIAIQLGAILAVLAIYRRRLVQLANGVVGRDDEGRNLLIRLVIAFLPAALIGAVFNDTIKDHLFGPWPIVAAWAAGGLLLVLWDPSRATVQRFSITDITPRMALIIGIAQVSALWPGVSRSLTTIVAALVVGCTMAAAVEFGFLLGLLTLTAATAFDLLKNGKEMYDVFGWRTPLLGALIAFVTAFAAVRWMLAYLRTRPLRNFGWYRLAVAGATIILIASGAI